MKKIIRRTFQKIGNRIEKKITRSMKVDGPRTVGPMRFLTSKMVPREERKSLYLHSLPILSEAEAHQIFVKILELRELGYVFFF